MPSDPTFLDVVGCLHRFLNRLARQRIRAVFARILTLEWQAPSGAAVTLAMIAETGAIWTDVGVALLPCPEAAALAHRYVERLADDLDLCINRSIAGGVWTVVDRTDRLPNLADVLPRLDIWAEALEWLAVRLKDAANGRS